MNGLKRFVFSAAVMAAAVSHSADPVLAVDMETLPGDRTQSNFVQMVVGNETNAVTRAVFGTYKVTIAGGSSTNCFSGAPHVIAYNSRDRVNHIEKVGSFIQINLIDLIRERVAVWGEIPVNPATGFGKGPGLYLMVEGLEPNIIYTIQAWGVDHVKNTAVLRAGYAYGFDATFEKEGYSRLPELGNYTVLGDPTSIEDNSQYSIVGNIISDSTGRIIYKSISNIDGCGIMNGFTLTRVGPVLVLGMAEPFSLKNGFSISGFSPLQLRF